MDNLYKLVFSNLYILKEIFKHVRLYNKNKYVELEDLESLKKYPERDYIQSLKCCDDEFYNLEEGDLPQFITSLEMRYVPFKNGYLPESLTSLTTTYYYDYIFMNNLQLPSSLKHLDLKLKDGTGTKNGKSHGLFECIPKTLESLKLETNIKITSDSGLYDCKLIKKCEIELYRKYDKIIKPYSIPQNVIDLTINNIWNNIKIGVIPNKIQNLKLYLGGKNLILKDSIPDSVTSLSLDVSKNKPESYPKSLTHLEFISSYEFDYTQDALNILISELPKTITSLNLPEEFEPFVSSSSPSIPSTLNLKYI